MRVVIALFYVVTAVASGQPATQPAGGPRILPWLEVNDGRMIVEDALGPVAGSEGRITMREYCVRGLTHWSKVTDTAIVSTSPSGMIGLYEYLRAYRPFGMRIIGGIKTYSLPGCVPADQRKWNFADLAGWQAIGQQAQHVAAATGSNVCLLDNETSLAPFYRDGRSIDLDRLERSLLALRATGIEFWWYLPSIHAAKVQDSLELIHAIDEALPNSRFVVDFVAYWDWRANTRTEATRRQQMIHLVGAGRVIDYLFVTADGYLRFEDGSRRYAHAPADARLAIASLSGVGTVGVYPGGANWVAVARAFAEARILQPEELPKGGQR